MEENITGSEDVKEASQGVRQVVYVDVMVTKKEVRNGVGEGVSEPGANLASG